MKKSLILVGMLAVGYANAQTTDPHEGKVGVNVQEPKATLDIAAYKTDGSTTEGLLIPRLSKEAVVKMANPEVSTLVYVTDEVLEADNAKFLGTGKGFYFYNGTKWVKQLDSDTDTNDAIWVKDGADARLDYPSSNYTTKYTAEGGYQLYPTDDATYPSISSTNSRTKYIWNILTEKNALNRNITRASDIDIINVDDHTWGSFNIHKIDKEVGKNNVSGYNFQTIVSEDNIMAGRGIQGFFNNVEHLGNTRLGNVEGAYISAALNGLNSSANTITGGVFDAMTNSDVAVGTMYGLRGRIRLNGVGDIDRLVGIRSEIALRGLSTETVSSNIKDLQGLYIGYNALGNARYTGTIDKAYDIYVESANYDGLKSRIKESYGVYVNGGHKVNYLAGSLGIGITKPTAKLDVVNNSARIAGKYFHKTSTSIPLPADTKEIITVRDVITDYQGTVTDAGTELQTFRTYEIQLNAQSETYYMDSRYIVFYDNVDKVWKSKLVSMNDDLGVQLAIAGTGNQIEIWHNRPNNYTLRATIVSTDTHSTAGASTYSFGLDGAMTNLAGNVGVGTEAPTEKLDVDGNIKATSLAGTGNRNVYADENGVLRVGEANTGATTLTGEENLACNDANRGKMNFVKDVTIGSKKGDAFAVCLKGTDGKFYWRYLYGAGGVTNSTENFGVGLK